ncbi:phosphoadenosine phosphosulfate reductase family protein [Hungatella effluvii]|uniref:phosphoadenosine phosphosulfate reductase domain-containing protein n=1 Tax=Hungatella effluvii TaxID=1096246 RepID=UPI0022E387F6|nr:phosphoadenosine phosphosulfate reductase family protein [Hungatella effluvii]
MASEMSLRLYGSPLVVTDSGGKDSTVCREIVRRSGIPYEVQHNLTTADAPQTIYYVRQMFRQLELTGVTCSVNYPIYKGQRVTMWTLIPMKKFPPTRLQRYCCQICKEDSCKDRFITTGVRWAESTKRKNNRGVFENFTKDPSKRIILNNDNDEKRMLFESCTVKGKRICNPIVDWEDRDIWEFIRCERLLVNPLYDMGFRRVGCLGCPMAGKNRWTEFRLFPTYERAYIRAFGNMLEAIHASGGKTKWKTAYDVFSWWMEEDKIEGQISLFDLPEWQGENVT